jgi:hypothetical protein
LTQLIFDGSYIIGLEGNEARSLSRAGSTLEKAEADARNQAAKAYFGVLSAEEGAQVGR